MRLCNTFFASSLCCLSYLGAAAQNQKNFDLVVYGATASGVSAAVTASREGLRVALVDPGYRVGGMVTNGVSHTDRGNVATIGGFPHEFFGLVGQHYGKPYQLDFEPHIALQVFQKMLADANVTIFLDARLKEHDGVSKQDNNILSISTENQLTFTAKVFVDSSYDGDLLQEAGVSSTWGRESVSEYGESKAGVLPNQRIDLQFMVNISPYGKNRSLLPGVQPGELAPFGSGDKKVPAYNYRLCITPVDGNKAPFPRPEHYDPARYALLARYLPRQQKALKRPLNIRDVMLLETLPNGKFDANNMGAFSTDNIGANWGYPTGSYAERRAIARDQYEYEAGFLYFLANDPQVPKALHDDINRYGLAKDEFTDNGLWPSQLYVREARRMLAEHIVTQHDVQVNKTKEDSIGLGSYQMDSHNVQRIATPAGTVINEGDMYVPTEPYEISYRSIVPKHAEVSNLIVPVCMGSSHAAFGTIRQEPVYMILGEAAGTAAAIAATKHIAVQDVPIPELQKRLLAQKAVLHWPAK